MSGLGWAGGARISTGPRRSGPKFLRAGPGRFLPIFREDFANIWLFLKEQYLILNELLIKFKFSLKNLLKIRIEIKLSMTGPARPEISAGSGRYGSRFLRAGPGRDGPRFQLGRDLQPCLEISNIISNMKNLIMKKTAYCSDST